MSRTSSPALHGQRDAGRVVEVRDRVEELGALARRGQRAASASRSASGTRPSRPSRRAGPAPGAAEDAERAHVGRAFGEHDVAGVEEDPGHQVERQLQPTVTTTSSGDAPRSPPAPSRRRSARAARGRPDRSRTAARSGRASATSRRHLADRVERQRGEVRHAAGEGHHLGPAGHGEQRPDLRRRHPCGTCREPLHRTHGIGGSQRLRHGHRGSFQAVGRRESSGRDGCPSLEAPSAGSRLAPLRRRPARHAPVRKRFESARDRPTQHAERTTRPAVSAGKRPGRRQHSPVRWILRPFGEAEGPVAARRLSRGAGSIYRRRGRSTRHRRRRSCPP